MPTYLTPGLVLGGRVRINPRQKTPASTWGLCRAAFVGRKKAIALTQGLSDFANLRLHVVALKALER